MVKLSNYDTMIVFGNDVGLANHGSIEVRHDYRGDYRIIVRNHGNTVEITVDEYEVQDFKKALVKVFNLKP